MDWRFLVSSIDAVIPSGITRRLHLKLQFYSLVRLVPTKA